MNHGAMQNIRKELSANVDKKYKYWVRRPLVVSFIKTFGHSHTTKHNLDDIFDTATILLYDK